MFLNLLAEAEDKTTSPFNIILIVVMIVAIIGLFVYSSISNKKKQKQAQDMVSSLKIGDRVKTIGGICGFVSAINDAENTFVLETGSDDNKSYVKFDKGAIYQTAPAQGNCVAAPATDKDEKAAEKVADKAEAKEEVEAPAEDAKAEKKAKRRDDTL